MPDELPPGFSVSTEEQIAQLHAAARAALASLDPSIRAAAIVLVLPDGSVTAAVAGEVSDTRALVALITAGPEVLHQTVRRFISGKGRTVVVPR